MSTFDDATTITVNGMPAGKDASGKNISAPKEMTRAEYEEMRTNDFYSMMPLFVTPDGSQAYPPPPSNDLIQNFNKAYDIMISSGCEKWSMNSRLSGIDLNHPVELVNGSQISTPLQQMQAPPDAGKKPYPGDWFGPQGSRADECGINNVGDKREYGTGSDYGQFGFKTINGVQEAKMVADYTIPKETSFIKSIARAIADTWSAHEADGKPIPKVTLAGGTQYNILGSAQTIAAQKTVMLASPVQVITQEANEARRPAQQSQQQAQPISRGDPYKKHQEKVDSFSKPTVATTSTEPKPAAPEESHSSPRPGR